MDKLTEKVWYEHSRSTLKSDSETCEIMLMKDFENTISDYNSEKKCENCKKCDSTKYPSVMMFKCHTNIGDMLTIDVKIINGKISSPFCFTNLFELKEK